MIPKRLDRTKTRGVLIDVQARLLPAMTGREALCARTKMLLQGLRILDIPVTVTQQYTRGLGETIPELMEAGGLTEYQEKLSFSCFREPEIVSAWRKEPIRDTFLLFGIEAHICVMQTALDLLDAGFPVFVVTDCVSSRQTFDKEAALRRLEQAGAVLTTAESALFELLVRAGSDEFKQISKLVK